MLYLAEVQRKARVLGGGKAEFKLLACQRSEQSWSAVPGEELVPAPDDVGYSAGALVMVELSGTRQVQRHSDAGRQLVSILQNFSRLQEKAKTQEEEIEQWKQSLTYQSQELNRREMELEARQEQLQQMEEDLARLDDQRQEVETTRAEVDQLRQEFERKTQELEGAWAHLRGEMNRFEERQAEYQNSATLDEAQANQIRELLDRLSSAIAPTESIREQLNLSFDIINHQQDTLNQYWQTLEQERSQAQHLQDDVDRQAHEIQTRWQQWHEQQSLLEQSQSELNAQQQVLSVQRDKAQALTHQVQQQDEIYQNLAQLSVQTGRGYVGAKVDVEALNKMPVDDLQHLVRELEQDLEKVSRFVNSQEEELSLQKQAMEDLEHQIQSTSDYDRLRLEAELADERESYEMLNETLVGQRRNLLEREEVLKRHQSILARRQGQVTDDGRANDIDLDPVLDRVLNLKQSLSQELRTVEAAIQQLQQSIDQLTATVEQQRSDQSAKLNELKQLESDWKAQRAVVAELWGKLNAYQETLKPAQESLNGLKERQESMFGIMAQFQEASDYQLQAIADMRQAIANLTGNLTPEFVS